MELVEWIGSLTSNTFLDSGFNYQIGRAHDLPYSQ